MDNEVHISLSDLINYGYGDAGGSVWKRSMRGFTSTSGSPDQDMVPHIQRLRSRSRMLYMSEPLATSAIKTSRTNVIGTGLVLTPRIDGDFLGISQEDCDRLEADISREFGANWGWRTDCDSQGINTFAQLQQIAFSAKMQSGDVFAILDHKKPGKRSPYGLRVNLVEADRCSTPTDGTVRITSLDASVGINNENGNYIHDGVEVDKSGAVVAYWFCNCYPTEYPTDGEPIKWTRIPAKGKKTGLPNVIHVMDSERPGQYRGIPFLAHVIEPLLQVRRYKESELTAAVIESCYTMAIVHKSPDDFGEPLGEGYEEVPHNRNEFELSPGLVLDLDDDESLQAFDPKRPTSGFSTFVDEMSKHIAASLEIPCEVLLKAFNSNYSAARAAILEAWKTFKMQRAWFVADFCDPLYEVWFTEAVARGRIKAPGFFTDPSIRAAYLKCEWIGPTPGTLDPLKEVTAYQMQVSEGFTTREDASRQLNGSAFDRNVAQIKGENERLADAQPKQEQPTFWRAEPNTDKESEEESDKEESDEEEQNGQVLERP